VGGRTRLFAGHSLTSASTTTIAYRLDKFSGATLLDAGANACTRKTFNSGAAADLERSGRFVTAMLSDAEHTMLEPIRRRTSPLTEIGDKG
jgi:hypothetical protein